MFEEMGRLTYGQMKTLREKHEKVSTEVFVLLSENDTEYSYRTELVKRYGEYSNVTFFSDGSVHMKSDGKGATAWIVVPHPSKTSSDNWQKREKKKEKWIDPSLGTPPF